MVRMTPLLSVLLLTAPAFSQAGSGLKLLAPGVDEALAVSDDGTTLLLNRTPPATPAVYAVSSGTTTAFGLPGATGNLYSFVHGVNANGAVLVANQNGPNGGPLLRAGTTVYAVGALFGVHVSDVSESGLIVVGTTPAGGRWVDVATSTVLDLGSPAAGGNSDAQAVSGDGRYVVGETTDPSNPLVGLPFRYDVANPSAPWVLLAAPGSGGGTALAVDGTGDTVVGYVWNNGQQQAFAWTPTTGSVALGVLPGYFHSRAFGVSRDGRWVVGTCENAGTSRAFAFDLQDPSLGMIDLTAAYASFLPAGFVLEQAWDVSADGTTIVGQGLTAAGLAQGWYTIP